jgi:pyroglutamyl-peptidase
MMKRILLTGFEPFDQRTENSSALCVSAVSRRNLPVDLVPRIYPVDFDRARLFLERDLLEGFDFAVHLGQNELSSSIRLERAAYNTRADIGGDTKPLLRAGTAQVRTELPLRRWVRMLRAEKIPVTVSNDPGCYVCNAVYYWSLSYAAREPRLTQSVFIHIPLAPTQIVESIERLPSLPTEVCANAVEIIIRDLSLQTPSERPAFAIRATRALQA